MLTSLFYVLSNLFLIVSFLIIKKTDEKQNLIKWIVISFGLLFCYNAILIFILSLLGIPAYLLNLTIINSLISIFVLFLAKKNKRYQQYFILKKDIIVTIIFAIIILLLAVLRFGLPFNIVYETCDPGTHFLTSKDFFEQSYLLNKVVDNTIVNFETRQFASYVNLGLFFKVSAPFIDNFDFYQLYILFDIGMLLLSALMFYVLICSFKKNINIVILIIGTLLYVLGYPLNSLMIGFFYLGHSITIIMLLFILYRMYDLNVISHNISLILIMLTTLGLFFTYYFFVPVVFGGLFIYSIYKKLRNKEKLITLQNIIFAFLVYILPCILGFIYFILPNINNSQQNFVHQLSLDGYCYVDIYSSFIIFLPFIIYYFIYSIRKKYLSFEFFIYILLLFFILVIIIFWYFGIASPYYLSKLYYLLWLLSFTIIFKVISECQFDKIKFLVSFLISIVICGILLLTNFESYFRLKTPDYIVSNSFDKLGIYGYNISKYLNPTIVLNNEELRDLKNLYNNGIRNVTSNALPYTRLWLIAYFSLEKIDYPENKLYDYIVANYYTDSSSINLNNSILFYRESIKKNPFDNDYDKLYGSYKIKEYETFLYIEES